MENSKLKRLGQSLIVVLSLVLFSIACNNKTESTSSPANDSVNASVYNDSTVSNLPVTDTGTVTSSTGTAVKKPGATKKGRASVGTVTSGKTTVMKPDRTGVYEMTETRPAFPGGQAALEDYINNHIEYPQMAIDDSKQGTVNIQFVVDENGNVRNARVLGTSLGDGLDEEAMRVISSMPKWEPGKVKGKNVKTRLTLPITYQIEE